MSVTTSLQEGDFSVTCLFYIVDGSLGPSMLFHMLEFPSLLRLNNIPFCVQQMLHFASLTNLSEDPEAPFGCEE